ncbi:MAG: hypothetical protein J2P28_05775 [Actinobacteria bacterium]|nr:hypothetical protein [Actinomycetota bacterium]MBO0835016.1 hypothetical protein [Actinomycetota bacterium]
MANQTVICTYRVRADAETEFRGMLRRHWPTLHELGFVTGEPSVIYRELGAPPTYVEIFTWAEGGYEHAREHPAVLAIWAPMDPLLESRGGLPKWDFPHYERVALGSDGA